uniref:ADP-ribosylation factor-like protein 13B n=1 Tax=Cacopsylla melanoneura TaxID=428564 RepID=A0A8D9AZV5_9HEMI
MKYKPLLLLANKQDLEVSMDEVDIVERLNVHSLVNEHKCPTTIELCNTVEPPHSSKRCCSKAGSRHDGIQVGFRWLMKQIDEYYDDLQLRIEAIIEKEQKEYLKKREKWKRERKLAGNGMNECEEEEEEEGGVGRVGGR